jgi:hypothetical protein
MHIAAVAENCDVLRIVALQEYLFAGVHDGIGVGVDPDDVAALGVRISGIGIAFGVVRDGLGTGAQRNRSAASALPRWRQ